MSKKKILFILTYYRPHWTGLTQYAARVAEGLADRGYTVTVLCSQHNRDLKKNETLSGVNVVRVPYLFKLLRSVVMPLFPLELIRKVRESDAVMAYLPLQEVILVALTAKIFGKKIFLVHNGDLKLPQGSSLLNRLAEKVYVWTTSWSITLSDGILVQSEDYSRSSSLLSRHKDKWRVVLPLFDIPGIGQEEVDSFIKKHDLKNKVVLGFSGRFVEEKGVDYLLEAMPLVAREIPNVHLMMAGDYKIQYENFWGKVENTIVKLKDRVTLLGLVEGREIYAFYKSLDVLVQPSRSDCFPSSQIEALLCGIPSVCTDIPGARWVVKTSGMGEIVAPHDPKKMAEGIIKVIKNRSEYTMRHNKIVEIFDYKETLNKYEELLHNN